MELKPVRRFLVRVLDLKTGRSRNISVYGEGELDKIYSALKDYLRKVKG